MSEMFGQAAAKRKSKKRRKGKSGKGTDSMLGSDPQLDKTPKVMISSGALGSCRLLWCFGPFGGVYGRKGMVDKFVND